LAAFFSVLTFFTQKSAGSVSMLDRVPLWARLENACTAYLIYVMKALWPVNLAVLYPFHVPRSDDVFLSLIILLAITAIALKVAKSRPYVTVGWFWFLGMLVPVIGIVQVGNQALADRYTYLPLVGLSIALIWWLADIIERRPAARRLAWAFSVIVLTALGAQAHHVTSYWADSRSLFARALDVTENNWTMEDNLAVILNEEKRYDEAAALWQKAIAGNPAFEDAKKNYALMKNNLGVSKEQDGKLAEATTLYRDAVTLNPSLAIAQGNLGSVLLKAGQIDEAKIHLIEALRVNPSDPLLARARGDLGFILAAQGQLEEARQHLEASIALQPKTDTTHSNLCWVFLQEGRTEEAISQCQEALTLNPTNQAARRNLTNALAAPKKPRATVPARGKKG
jgi:tetratricopeptide (TPR) repeat protein